MDRRRFLTLLGLAPVAASTKAYSFLGGILRPRPPQVLIPTVQLQSSVDGVNWFDYHGDAFKVSVLSNARGIIDATMMMTDKDILDVGSYRQDFFSRYVRLKIGSPDILISPS